ncbi:DUF4384 domain-containing protein [Leptospira brenneri]|uniref:DUF4384 domain-containing protein n=1 Tax=Leptospira brenneri TaxID=2023182 RepID=UPI000C29CE53|nr:DUF4384 domain-containing protein [Leptospira brenneri]PJZ44237.1 hypothetical protein CH361_16475 [Leptospira brenneri]
MKNIRKFIILIIFGSFPSYCALQDRNETTGQEYSVSGDSNFIQSFRVMILPPTKPERRGKNGILTAESRYDGFVAELKSALISSGKVTVIDREKTDRALEEIAFAKTGLVDSSTAPKIGRITGAEKMVSPIFHNQIFSISLTDIETTKVEFSKSIPLDQYKFLIQDFTKFLEHKLLLTNMSKLSNPNPVIRASLKSSKKSYKNNDPIHFEISVSEDTFVYLLLIQNDGEIFTLFPNEDQPNNYLKGGESIVIPNLKAGFVLTAGEPFGVDVVKLIASKEKMNLFLAKRVEGSPFGQITESGDRITRGIKKFTTGVKTSDWSSAEISIETGP